MTYDNRRSNRPHRGRSSGPLRTVAPRYAKIQLDCSILSPVHIGTGEEIPIYEYLIRDGLFYKINLNKFISRLTREELLEFNRINQAGDYAQLRYFLINKYADEKIRQHVTQFVVPVSNEVEQDYQEKWNHIENQGLIHLNQRNPLTGAPIIPGSSLKGAIRTAILNALVKRRYGERIHGNASFIEGKLLNALNSKGDRFNPIKDPFKYLKIDEVSLDNHDTQIAKVYNTINGEDGFMTIDIQMIFEITHSMLSGSPVNFSFSLLISSQMKVRGRENLSIDAEYIINACRDYYKSRLERYEVPYFENSPILNEVNKIYNAVDFSRGEFLLRVGRFSGKMSVTLDAYRRGPDPISRNLASGKYPMGWIKCAVKERQGL